jgi:CDP-diacylglycerol---glycerol-3-phosphate 3-phosphatidyltransferase
VQHFFLNPKTEIPTSWINPKSMIVRMIYYHDIKGRIYVNMTATLSQPDFENLRRLKLQWGGWLLLALAFLSGCFFFLRLEWGTRYALGWLAIAGGICLYLFANLWRNLASNRLNSPGAPLFADLGAANAITVARGVLVAALAGLLAGPWPRGSLAWAPGILYLLASLMDFADGWVARASGRSTVLGEMLDMQWDGTGMLVASALAVRYGQAPVPYLLVGLARYLYLAAVGLRQRSGRPVFDLPPSRFRRPLAGMQMGFAAVVILPVFHPPATQLAAWLFMTPFLLGFLRDGLWVTGLIEQSATSQTRLARLLREALPLVLRGLVLALLGGLLLRLRFQPGPELVIALVAVLAIPALGLGVAGRVAALAVLLASGFGLQFAPLEWGYWFLLFSSAVLFMTGTGRYSLWKPEEWLIDNRAGEARK